MYFPPAVVKQTDSKTKEESTPETIIENLQQESIEIEDSTNAENDSVKLSDDVQVEPDDSSASQQANDLSDENQQLPKINIAESLNRHLQKLDNINQQNLASASAQQHMKSRRSPQINTQRPTITLEQRQRILRRIQVDCQNAAKRGLSFISGILGGTIECRSYNGFQQYIDKHLNKRCGKR